MDNQRKKRQNLIGLFSPLLEQIIKEMSTEINFIKEIDKQKDWILRFNDKISSFLICLTSISQEGSIMSIIGSQNENKLLKYYLQHQKKDCLEEIMKLPNAYIQKLTGNEKSSLGKKQYIPRQGERGPYRSYSLEEKQYVVRLHISGLNFAKISKILDIPQKNVVRWCKQGCQRKQGAGRRVADRQMEQKLAEWLNNAIDQEQDIKMKEVQEKAKQLSFCKRFKASKGWMKNFLRRFKFQSVFQLKND